jgi:hypothetical protein
MEYWARLLQKPSVVSNAFAATAASIDYPQSTESFFKMSK